MHCIQLQSLFMLHILTSKVKECKIVFVLTLSLYYCVIMKHGIENELYIGAVHRRDGTKYDRNVDHIPNISFVQGNIIRNWHMGTLHSIRKVSWNSFSSRLRNVQTNATIPYKIVKGRINPLMCNRCNVCRTIKHIMVESTNIFAHINDGYNKDQNQKRISMMMVISWILEQ